MYSGYSDVYVKEVVRKKVRISVCELDALNAHDAMIGCRVVIL